MATVNLSKQTINLSKKEVVNLSKQAEGLKKVMVGLGWDEAEDGYQEIRTVKEPGFIGKLFGAKPVEEVKRVKVSKTYDFDLDAWVGFLKDGKIDPSEEGKVFYGRRDAYNKGITWVHHHGDNLTGEGEGDDEQITIDLSNIPDKYNGIAVMVTIYQAKQRKQAFGDIKNFFVRVVDERDDFEICRYADSVAQEYKDCYTFVVGKLYKDKGEWQFKSEGYGTKDGSISDAVQHYRG